MILKRGKPRTRWQKLREMFWPSMGWLRLVRYYHHRIGRLPGTPYFIAAGFATGIAVSFTPFVGFHIATAGVITWFLEGSLVAMVLGSVVAGNPWTYPFIWISTYKLGKFLMGQHALRSAPKTLVRQFTLSDLLDKPMDLLLPMTLGSIPLAIIAWFVSFYFVRQLIRQYKEARRRRIRSKTP
jgi:uncharacterized protein (DUF2062 family)